MTCSLCGRPIEEADQRRAYRQVVGWERPGKGSHGKSGSSLVLRTHTPAVAHESCIVRKQQGFDPDHDTLF